MRKVLPLFLFALALSFASCKSNQNNNNQSEDQIMKSENDSMLNAAKQLADSTSTINDSAKNIDSTKAYNMPKDNNNTNSSKTR
jgi:uncharacterized protein YcfL